MQAALDAARDKRMSTDEFCRVWRDQAALLGALPPRYGVVMEDLLGRMEAASLFGEESCSFSPEDLYAGLASWVDKARQTLDAKSIDT